MLKYNDFLEDQLLESLLLESALYFVKDFKDILINIEDKNKIAKDLIDVEYTVVEPDMTIISLGDEPGKIKFMQINNFTKSIEKGYQKLLGDSTMPENLQRTIDMLVQKAKSGTISQTDVNYLYNSPDFGIKGAKSRNVADLGRLVNKVFPGKYTDSEREQFVNQFKAALLDKSENAPKFELVSGKEIIKWYDVKTYISETGTLGDSCMRYSRCSTYFDIYTQNQEVCQLLIFKEGNRILGRALIWKLDKPVEGAEYFMDRVYSIDDSVKTLFDDWANEKGYLRKHSYNQSYMKRFLLGDKELFETIGVKLEKWKFDMYPYMDTFKKLDVKGGILINDDDDRQTGYYILEDTNGGYRDTSSYWSTYYEEYIPIDKAVWSDSEDSWLWRDTSIEVEIGNNNEGWYPEDSKEIVEDPFRGWIHIDDSRYSEWYGEYIYKYDLTEVVTRVEESSTLKNFKYYVGELSEEDPNIIDSYSLDCYNYLYSLDLSYLSFPKDILHWNNKSQKYYFSDLEIKVYGTDSGLLSELDCKILGIDHTKFLAHYTDEIAYNFALKDKAVLIKKLEEKINSIESYLTGEQPTLVFSQDEEEELKYKNNNLLHQLKARLNVLKRWI